jgi:hypothetical protein
MCAAVAAARACRLLARHMAAAAPASTATKPSSASAMPKRDRHPAPAPAPVPGAFRVTTKGAVHVSVRVTPGARDDGVALAATGDVVAVRTTAPPRDGAANAAVCLLVAQALQLPKRAASVVAGESSRDKVLLLADVTAADVARLVEALRASE